MKKIAGAVLIAAALVTAFAGCKKKQMEMTTDNSLEELKARGVLIIGLDDSLPPLGFRNDDGDIVGFDIDLAKEVAGRLGVEFKAQPIDWDAKELELSTGKIDCIWNGLTMTPEREAALSFTKAYLNNDQVLVVRKDGGINSLADMAAKVIGIQSGSSAQNAVNANSAFADSVKETIFFKDNITALNDLLVGGVDGVVMDSVVAAYDIAQSKKPLVIVDESLAKEKYGIAFRKGDVKLTEEVQKILEEMAADGTAASISMRWFGEDISVIGK
ncbi:MAG: amino acid ABC transporter substrate-binding protein [Treponema sp.]